MAFLHEARGVRDLPAEAVERIARRLNKPAARPRRMLLWPAWVALALGMSAGATYAVAKGGLRALPLVGSLFAPKAPPPSQPDGPRPRRARPAPAAPQPAPTAPAPARVPSPEPVPPASTQPPPAAPPTAVTVPASPPPSERPTRSRTLAARTPGDEGARLPTGPQIAPPAMAAEDPIVSESHSFAVVIEAWHRRGDASAALALLDAHEGRYPAGHMRLEGRILRAELYLAQGRGSEALAVLDAMSLSGIPRTRELQTLRGELRVKAGRCHEARADLGSVLEKNVSDVLAKRAAQALAHCP